LARLKRLVSERISSFERRLLERGAQERPTFGARKRMAHALGISPLVVYASVAKGFMSTWLGNVALGLAVATGVTVAAAGGLRGPFEPAADEPVSQPTLAQSKGSQAAPPQGARLCAGPVGEAPAVA
jgi:hypothetical protein